MGQRRNRIEEGVIAGINESMANRIQELRKSYEIEELPFDAKYQAFNAAIAAYPEIAEDLKDLKQMYIDDMRYKATKDESSSLDYNEKQMVKASLALMHIDVLESYTLDELISLVRL